MKSAVLYLTVLGCVLATPTGYYHQEYNYKTSSSSYKNNELQHQTDDQGYYKKDGDIEGRFKPKVDANSEHSEYVNPNLRNSGYLSGGPNADGSSYGSLRADVGSYGHNLAAEGLASSDHLIGTRGYSDYSSGYGANSYGSSSQSYATASTLRSVTARLQQELEREIQEAVQDNRAYGHLAVADLERDLRQNLTSRLNSELRNRYGQESIRGGLSYTIADGRLQSTANYDSRELEDLQRQIENSLLNKLRTQYTQSYDSSSSSHYQQGSSQSRYGYASTTTVRPVYYNSYTDATYRPTTTIRSSYPADYANYGRYTPIRNPETITNIASRVQSNLDTRLNELLQDAERKYFSSSSAYSLTNTDVVLETMRRDLKSNITYLLNEDVKRNYGNQVPRDGYMYTTGPNGETSTEYNYSITDLENLRAQIERHLVEKLNREFERHRSRWSSQQSYGQSSQSSNNYNNYNTPRYDIYNTPRYDSNYNAYDSEVEHLSTRPTSPHITPLITSKGGRTNQIYQSTQSEFGMNAASGSSISQLQTQLQQDLSRQLQAAISKGHYGSYSSSSGAYGNPQSYQISLQQLTDELNRNLTRQLQEYSAGGYYSAHGNFDQSQMAGLRSRLQNDLMRQLQQGLQQSFHASSSYSSSSSSTAGGAGSYRPVRGFENYQIGQYRTGGSVGTMQGEDCNEDDPNAYTSHRMKRSIQPYRSQPLGLGYSGGNRDYPSNYRFGNNHRLGAGGSGSSPQEVGQQVEDDVEELGQLVDESDLTQQISDPDFGSLTLGTQGQHVDDTDLTQQVEEDGFGRLQTGSQRRQETEVGQQVDDSDLTQQVEDDGFGRLESGSRGRQELDVGQQVDDSDLTQQVEDDGFGRLQSGSQGRQEIQVGQEVDDSDLTQQVADTGVGKLHSDSQHRSNQHRQYDDDLDLNHQQDISDLKQQVEDVNPERLTPQSQTVDVAGQRGLTQQREDHFNIGSLEIGSQTQRRTLNRHQTQTAKQLEEELSKQLQEAIQSQQQSMTYSSSGSASPQSYQVSLQHLSDELSRNLSKQLQDISTGRHGSYSYHILSNLNQRQLEELKAKLQSDLTNQLQKGLQQSYQYSASWNNHQVFDHQTDEARQASIDVSQHNLGKPTGDGVALTQQVESNPFEDQENSDLVQQVEENTFRKPKVDSQQLDDSNNNHVDIPSSIDKWNIKDLNKKQLQFVEQLNEDLSKQLKSAVKSEYYDMVNHGPSKPTKQMFYQRLVKELKRKITKLLDDIRYKQNNGQFSYSTYDSFNEQQLATLKIQLEYQLKLQLQHEMSTYFEQGDRTTTYNGYENLEFETPQQHGQRNDGRQRSESSLNQSPFKPGSHLTGQQTEELTQTQEDLTQQTQDIEFGDPQSEDISGYNQHPLTQDNSQLTQQVELNHQVRRPVTRKPLSSNSFIESEINSNLNQHTFGQQDNLNLETNDLSSLNQVLEHQQPGVIVNSEYEAGQPIRVPENTIGSSTQQQQTVDFPHLSANKNDHNGMGISPLSGNQISNGEQQSQLVDAERDADLLIAKLRESQRNRPSDSQTILQVPVQDSFTQNQESFGVSLNQEQLQLAKQLEKDLSRQLENAVKEHYYTSTYSSSGYSHPQLGTVGYQQLSEQLQNNLTKQLEEIFSEAGSHGVSNSYSVYGALTDEQKQQLLNQIKTDLSEKLQRNLQVSYNLQKSGQYEIGSTSTYSSVPVEVEGTNYVSRERQSYKPYSTNSNNRGQLRDQFHYGHQGHVEQNFETLHELQPPHHYRANVIQDVEPQFSYNSGVKSHRPYGRNRYTGPTPPPRYPYVNEGIAPPSAELLPPPPPPGAEFIPPPPPPSAELRAPPPPPSAQHIPPVPSAEILPPPPGAKSIPLPDYEGIPASGLEGYPSPNPDPVPPPSGEPSEDIPQENLPWWKRFGNKVKVGAQSLKEKIIG